MKNEQIIQSEIIRRRDMRDVLTFTVDPADAKDFDDALSFVRNEDGTMQIGVHIADVSFFVRPGTSVDEEAYRRGTSVYLVDRVLPMLPEELCNDLCSLRPGEDKLCMSVIFTMDDEARVLKHKICRTVIRSDARLNYDEVQEILMAPEKANQTNETLTRENRNETSSRVAAEQSLNVEDALRTLGALASRLRAERIANGALTIEQDEIRFRLDEQGKPQEIYFDRPNESHHLIEEFMLLANRTIAKSVGSGRPFVYRVHDIPDQDKMEEFRLFKQKRGSRVAQQVLDMMLIRAQAKAVYSTYNIGHYGLAFTHYTHFTSPIRRYPDLMVHRLVDKYLLTGKKESLNREELELMCEHCSGCEQEAQQAERESVKQYQTMWMEAHLGEQFSGHISGVTEFGLFVQLDDSRCEGLIHVSTLPDGWQQRYLLGDNVRVQVVRVDVIRCQIDFLLI